MVAKKLFVVLAIVMVLVGAAVGFGAYEFLHKAPVVVHVDNVAWYYVNQSHPLVNGSGFNVSGGGQFNDSLKCGFCLFNSSIDRANVSAPFVVTGFDNVRYALNVTIEVPSYSWAGNLSIYVSPGV